ncbi:gliding motility protein GldL [Cryomorphaceae bacterium 1068]|nr:gliding motility protein GldL [Cryomorphaceae bacterium 1068]
MKPGSKSWKKFMAKLYGIGAAVVIIGALFKIQHWPFAGALLVVGLTTEAVIFFFSAFEPVHEELDWSLVYPELRSGEPAKESLSRGDDESITEQLDNMLEEAKIEPELIASLGNGLRSLSSQAEKLNEISDASVATNEYTESLKGASAKVGELSDSYARASEALTGLTEGQAEGASTGEHLKKMSSNLAELNNMYETQLQELQTSSQLYSGITELMKNLNESVEDTKKYKENISELASNLSRLNTVYGNMLSAMSAPASVNV